MKCKFKKTIRKIKRIRFVSDFINEKELRQYEINLKGGKKEK